MKERADLLLLDNCEDNADHLAATRDRHRTQLHAICGQVVAEVSRQK